MVVYIYGIGYAMDEIQVILGLESINPTGWSCSTDKEAEGRFGGERYDLVIIYTCINEDMARLSYI